MWKKSTNHGFTLLELLLSVAIVGVLGGLSLPVYRALMSQNDTASAAATVATSLRRAQLLSQGPEGDTTHGVKVQNGSIVVFRGVSYATRDTTYDETFDEPSTLSVSGLSEVVFEKFTGLPQTTGTITIAGVDASANITINAKGMINY